MHHAHSLDATVEEYLLSFQVRPGDIPENESPFYLPNFAWHLNGMSQCERL